MNSTVMGATFMFVKLFTTILAISSNTYDTVSATKMRMISTNDEKRRTLEYVRNALKNIRFTATVHTIVTSMDDDSEKRLRKSYRSA
jgi:hypothetical protein